MNCTLTAKQQEKFLIKVYRNLEDLSNTDKNFILDDYIKEIHDLVLDITKDQTLAYVYAQITPEFVSLALTGQRDLRSNLRKKGLNLEALADKAESFEDIESVISDPIFKTDAPTKEEIDFNKKHAKQEKKKINKGPSLAELEKINKEKEEKQKKQADEALENEINSIEHKKSSPLGTTGQEASIDENGVLQDNSDPRIKYIYDFLPVLRKAGLENGGDFDTLELGGHTGFRVTPIKKSEIDQSIIHQRDKDLLEGKEFIAKNPTQAKKIYENTVEFFITDLDGNILYFDKNNNIVEKENGKPIYYPMPIAKYENKKYKLSNRIDENKLMTPEQLAKYNNKDTWSELDEDYRTELIKQAEEQQQLEIKSLYDLQKVVKKDPSNRIPLQITNISVGIPTAFAYKNKLVPVSDINFEASNLNKSQSIKIAERDNQLKGEKNGWAYLILPGQTKSIKLERVGRTKKEADTLAELIVNDKLKFDGKPIESSEKMRLFENQVVTSGNVIKMIINDNGDLEIKIRNKKLDLSKKDEAKDILSKFLIENVGATPEIRAENLKNYGDNVFYENHAEKNLPKDLQSEFEQFEIVKNKVIIKKVDPIQYIIDNTKTGLKLDNNGAIPVLNGYVMFDVTEEDLTKENKNLEQQKKDLEKEISEVEKEIAKIEKEGLDEKAKSETKKIVKQLSLNFPKAVNTVIEEEITPEEITQAAVEENISEEEVKKKIVEEVDKALQTRSDEDFAVEKKSDSFLKKLARRIFTAVRNLIIAGVMYTGVTAASFEKGTYDFNNVIEHTADILNLNNLTSEYSETFILAASKLGLYDMSVNESTIDISKVKEAQKVKALKVKKDQDAIAKATAFRQYKEDNTYFEKIDVVEDSHYKARKGSKDSLLSARNQWFNEDGFTYVSGAIQSRMEDGETISGVEGVAHFMILDDLGIDLSIKTSDKELIAASKSFKQNRIGKDIAMTDYVPVFDRGSKNKKIAEDIKKQEYAEAQRLIDEAHPLEKKAAESLANLQREAADKKFNKVVAKENKKVTVNYKVASEIDSSDITITRLHQYNFDDIDFKSKISAKPFGFHGGGVYALTNKAGVGMPNFLFTSSGKGAYSRFSGGSYVLIFKDKQGNEIVHEISGSLELLEKEGNDLAKNFGIKTSDITLGVYDAGSYSAKPAANTEGVIETDQYRNYNKIHPHSGGALIFPKAPVDPVTASLLFLSPLGIVRKKRKDNKKINNRDLQDLKDYKDELQNKLDLINKIMDEKVTVETVSENPANIKDSDPSFIDPKINTDLNDVFGQALEKSKKGKKLPFRFEKLLPGYKAKAKKAGEWYNSHPFKTLFPVKMAMHVANSNAYATWTKHGVTLYKGSSKTDLYHEAWHGFSQFFLTPEEKQSLYNEVADTEAGHKALKKFARKQKVDVNTISQNTKNLVMEEYLAEDFRKFKLSNGKKVLGSPIRNSIFKRILNFFKEFFGVGTIKPTMDINTIGRVKEFYDELNLTDGKSLVNYSPSQLNMMPGITSLNKGPIIPLDKNSTDAISYSDAILVRKSFDSIMSSVVDQKVKDIGPHVAAAVYNQPELVLPALYQKVKDLFVEKLADVESRIKTEQAKPSAPVDTQPQTSKVEKKGTINVYWGGKNSSKPENHPERILSNLAKRQFTWKERKYGSVEHAYQSNKSGTFDQATYNKYEKIGGYGSKIRGKGTVAEMKAADSLGLMKQLVVESFKQNSNSEAAKVLMQYENFTHNTNQLIDQAFLEGLVLAQQELESTQPTQQTSEVDLGTETAPAGGNVIVDGVKGRKPQPGAVVAFRTKGKTEQNMIDALKDNAVGNPFGPYGAIKEETVVSVTRFLNWLEGKGDTNVMQNYRKAILNKASELKEKPIFYYKDLGRPSHATALDYFLNKSTQQTSEVETYKGFVDIKNLKDNEDTVFGSNQDGFHGGGTAGILYANDSRAYKKQDIKGKGLRVEVGKAKGFQTGTEGSSYALQTVTDWKLSMSDPKRQVPKAEIIEQIKDMYDYYKKNSNRKAYVLYTTEGKNLNGYTSLEMAEMFASAGPIPSNVIFNEDLIALVDITEPVSKVVAESTKNTIDPNKILQLTNQKQILNFTIKNFGEPKDWVDAMKGVSEDGVVAYHLKKSEFLSFNPKEFDGNFVEDLAIENTWAKSSDKFSMSELTSSQIRNLVFGAKKYNQQGEIEKNSLGFEKLLDFNVAFKTLITLTRNLDEPILMASKLNSVGGLKDQNTWIKTNVLSKLGPVNNPRYSQNTMNLWTNFWQTFYKAYVPSYQLTVEEVIERLNDNTSVTKTTAKFGRAQGAFKQVRFAFINEFKTTKGEFIIQNENGANQLDVEGLKRKYKGSTSNRKVEFLKDIGLPITDNIIIKKGIDKVNTDMLYDKIIDYNKAFKDPIVDIVKVLTDSYPKAKINNKRKALKSESTNMNKLYDLEYKYSNKYGNDAEETPDGNRRYADVRNSTLTKKVQAFNKAKSFDDLVSMPYMSYLDPARNTLTKNGSVWLNTIFEMDKPGKPKRKDISVKLDNVGGTILIRNESNDFDFSTTSAKSDKFTRLMQDIYGLLMLGKPSNFTPADKSTVLTTSLSKIEIENDKNKVSNHLYIDTADFLVSSKSNEVLSVGGVKAKNILINYIQAEIDRIKNIELGNQINVKGVTTDILNEDGTVKTKARAKDFQIFDGMFSKDVKKKLLALKIPLDEYLKKDTKVSKNLSNLIDQQLAGFIETEVEDIKERMGDLMYFDSNIISNLNSMLSQKNIVTNTVTKDELITYKRQRDYGKISLDKYNKIVNQLQATEKEVKETALLESYVMNLFIHNVELLNFTFGDLSQYKDFFKRNPGAQSDGYQFRNDAIAQDYINETMFNTTGEHFRQTYANKMFPKLSRVWDGVLNTAVVRETVVESYLLPEYRKAFIDYYTKLYIDSKKYTEKEALAKAKLSAEKAVDAYKNMEEGDGQGWITFDAYKMLSILQGKWLPEQDKLYNEIIAGKQLTLTETATFFPARKYQYFGELATKGMPLTAFHKYSLMPLIPNVIDGTNMEVFHDNLVKQNIDYALHESGSKVSTIYPEGSEMASQLWENFKDRVILEDAVYENNPIYIEYLKDQLDINNKFKGGIPFSTQMRKLIEIGLMEDGLPTDFNIGDTLEDREAAWNELSLAGKKKASPKYTRVIEYEESINEHVRLKKEEILESLGSSLTDLREGKGNMELIADVIIKELDRQDMGIHELAMIELNETGNDFKYDLSISPSAEKIERVLTAFVNAKLITAKVNGEALVQFSTTMMESRNATPEEKEKWGNSDLRGYRQEFDKNGKVVKNIGADAKIALQGDFVKLLQLKGLDGKKVGVKDKDGNILEKESLDRLNALINNEAWRANENNLKLITIVGVRIPVQGINNMEFFHIKQFLPKAAGPAIIPPSEIVAKSGADFDIDKLQMMMPKIIINNGEVKILNVQTSTKSKSQIQDFIDINQKIKNAKAKQYKDKIKTLVNKLSKEAHREVSKTYYPQLNALYDNLDKVVYAYELAKAAHKKDTNYYTVKELNRTEKNMNTVQLKIEDLESLMTNVRSEIYYVVNLTPEIKDLVEARNEELSKLSKKLDDYKELKESISSKAYDNKLMLDILNILQDPDNFVNLIMPIDAGVAKEKAALMNKQFKDSNIGYNPEKGWKKKPGDSVKDTPGVISPTKVLTAVFNNYMHDVNSIGKDSLGLGAIDNTFNVLANRIGLHMNPFYGFKEKPAGQKVTDYYKILQKFRDDAVKVIDDETSSKDQQTEANLMFAYAKKELDKVKQVRIFLPHNSVKYDGYDVVSLSKLNDVNYEHNIANLISQLINGWVDVAKGAWIFDIQGNKQISPVLLYMIQAGVPFSNAVDFLSNPLILEYVDKQLSLSSPIAALDPANESIANMASEVSREAKNYILETYGSEYWKKDMYSNAIINPDAVYRLSLSLNNKDFNDKTLHKIASGKATADVNFKAFLHFLEIEEQSKGIDQLKLTLTYDTTKTSSLFTSALSESKFNELLESTMVPSKLIEKFITDTPIGAFKIQGFITDLWSKRFKLKGHDELTKFLIKKFNDYGSKNLMKERFGTVEKYIETFRNDLLVYSFLEYFNEFDINNIKGYKGLDVSIEESDIKDVDVLRRGVAVVKENGKNKIYLDKASLQDQFNLKTYSETDINPDLNILNRFKYKNIYNLNSLGVAPVDEAAFNSNASLYYKFVIERELLRANNSTADVLKLKPVSENFEASVKNKSLFPYKIINDVQETEKERKIRLLKIAYENWLRDTALRNNLNMYSLFRGKNTVAQTLKSIKNDYPHLEKMYGLLEELIVEEGSYASAGYKNFKLRKTKLTSDEIDSFHDNWLELADPNKIKISGNSAQVIAENKRISKFFEDLPIYGFLQAGLNVTDRFSVTRVMPFEKLTSFLVDVAENTSKKLNNAYLNEYYASFNTKNFNPRLRRDKNYEFTYDLTIPAEAKGLELINNEINSVYKLNVTNKNELVDIIKNNPDVMFVVEKGNLVDTKVYVEGIGQIDITSNMQFLNTRQFATDSKKSYLQHDKQKENSEIIKGQLTNIYDLWANNGNKVAFMSSGYGEYMLNESETGGYVNATIYGNMSQALYDLFGYTNKNSKFFNQIAKDISLSQVVSDQSMEQSINDELEKTLAEIDKC